MKKFHLPLSPVGRQMAQLVLIVFNSKDCITSVRKYPDDGAMCHSYTLILLAKGCPKMPLRSQVCNARDSVSQCTLCSVLP